MQLDATLAAWRTRRLEAQAYPQLVIDAPRRLVPLEYLLPATDAFPTLLPLGGAATAL